MMVGSASWDSDMMQVMVSGRRGSYSHGYHRIPPSHSR